MNYFKDSWPAIICIVVSFGIHLARYIQWKWCGPKLSQSSQIKWLLRIYGVGFFIAGMSFWFGLSVTSELSWFEYPKSVEEIQTPEKLLQLLQKYNKAASDTTRVLFWFIFFCMIWVTNLLLTLSRALKEQPTENDVFDNNYFARFL